MPKHAYRCFNCGRVIQGGNEEWISDRPYGSDCAPRVREKMRLYKERLLELRRTSKVSAKGEQL